ncbi:MAG: helix-turn-helix domain-containing protein [Xanthobacteraceae bacterium]
MDIDELADYLRLSPSSIYKMLRDGRLPGYKVGKHWRFRRSAIKAWMDSQGNELASAFPSEVFDPPEPTRAAPLPAGWSPRSLQPRQADPRPVRKSSRPALLTDEHLNLLQGIWISKPEHFVAIARTAQGRVSLAKLLGMAPRTIDEIAETLEASPGAWPDRGAVK